MPIDIERLRLVNRLNFILAKSPFLELSPIKHGTNALPVRSALALEAFNQEFALEACDFNFMQMFQDFKDLDVSATDPLLLMGVFELFVGGLLSKGSDYLHSPLVITDYLINFNPDDFFEHISFFLKFKEHKFACILHLKTKQSRSALLQVADELLAQNSAWFEQNAIKLIEPALLKAKVNHSTRTSEALDDLEKQSMPTLLEALTLGSTLSQLSLDDLLLPCSLIIGRTYLSLQDLTKLKLGDALVLDKASFQRNLVEIVCKERHAFAQVNLAERSLMLLDELQPLHTYTLSSLEQLANTVETTTTTTEENPTLSQDHASQEQLNSESQTQTATLGSLDNLQLELCFELERRMIKLSELKTLTKGSLLALHDTDLSHVAVRVNDQLIARGQIVELDDGCALQITEILKQD